MPRVWMVMDPETRRVALRNREPGDGDFPPGPRGRGWSVRQGELADDVWAAVLAGGLSGEELDKVHQELWTEVGPTPWPNL